MGQHSLIYAFVARGTVVLAEHTDFTGNFTAVASQCLVKLPAANNKLTYYCDGHTFNYLVQDGFTYCVVAVESVGRQVPIAFLDRVKEDFTKIYGGGKAATAAANSLNRQFGSKLKEHMQYCVDHPEEVCKLAKVKAQVSEVKGVMMENIEKVLDRGKKIQLFVDKTENLHSQTDSVAKRLKVNKCSDDNNSKFMAAQADSGSAGKATSQNQSAPEPPKQDYIHVRARRGQATDSHSLAERARREKISERMKMLQDLVPGCNKVIGKASVLDEIINYIQSLQCQVEFLSMKLEAVNAHVGSAVGAFPSKDFGAQTYNAAPGLTFDTQAPREYSQGADTAEWLHMQIGGAYERVS